MKAANWDKDSLQSLVREKVLGPDISRATFAGVHRGGPSQWVRVTVRPVEIRGERRLQFSYFDGRKTLSKNFSVAEAGAPLDELLTIEFAGIHLSTHTEEFDLRTTKKGKVLVGRRAAEPGSRMNGLEHNRVKDVPIPEGQGSPLLEAMGILTPDGRVRPAFRAKHTCSTTRASVRSAARWKSSTAAAGPVT
jgi:hypothetical protein